MESITKLSSALLYFDSVPQKSVDCLYDFVSERARFNQASIMGVTTVNAYRISFHGFCRTYHEVVRESNSVCSTSTEGVLVGKSLTYTGFILPGSQYANIVYTYIGILVVLNSISWILFRIEY